MNTRGRGPNHTVTELAADQQRAIVIHKADKPWIDAAPATVREWAAAAAPTVRRVLSIELTKPEAAAIARLRQRQLAEAGYQIIVGDPPRRGRRRRAGGPENRQNRL